MKPDISIVIPLYNEVDNVAPLHARLMEAASALGVPFELVYVDDGSRDATFATLRTVTCTDEQALLIRFRRNFGQTAAIAAGVAQKPIEDWDAYTTDLNKRLGLDNQVMRVLGSKARQSPKHGERPGYRWPPSAAWTAQGDYDRPRQNSLC